MNAADHPALLLVDGVSSIGALEFKFDDWDVDVAVTGSQKALSLPTGLALVCASDKVSCWPCVGYLQRMQHPTQNAAATVHHYDAATCQQLSNGCRSAAVCTL